MSPRDSFRTESRSASVTFDNVLALLDEEQSRQLVERVIPAVTYTGIFEVVGRDDGLDPPTQLCSPCKRLVQHPPPMYSRLDSEDEEDIPPEEFWVPHHDTLFQLVDCCFSRAGSCRLCQLLWHGIRREIPRHRWNETENPNMGWHDGGLKVALLEHDNNTSCIGLNILLQPMFSFYENFHIRMVRERSVDAVKLHPSMAESTDSATTSNQIGKWMDNCLETHSLCRIPSPSRSERPTRLVLINYPAGTFQLTADFGPDTKYAAVSYRWGSGKDCYMLTRETAEGMRYGVSITLLPKTLLDACTIAHRIGLKYIWIDRLCIYQDSHEDWSQEASRMAFIYKHASLTISAACASHENQGCFRKRNVAGIQPLRLISNPLLSPRPTDGFHETSYITSNEPQENRKDAGKLGHLADRGWVFQERILSQRIVHFAQEEVYWECRELEASEAWPEGTESFSTPMRPSVLHGPGRESWGKDSLWHQVVEEFSTREFTYDRDRLPALSGLARETANLRKDADEEYLAGLWRSTVLCDLCWDNCNETPRIPEEYLSPTWSWASLHAKIGYSGSGFGYTPMAEFKDARLRFATADAYGAVLDGWMQLSGHLKPVTVVWQRTAPDQSQRQGQWPVLIRDVDGTALSFLHYSFGKLDIDSFVAGEGRAVPVFCLPVLKNREDEPETAHRPEFYCLLLVPNGSIRYKRSGEALASPKTPFLDEYQRAGLARMNVNNWLACQAWLAESPERDVVIR